MNMDGHVLLPPGVPTWLHLRSCGKIESHVLALATRHISCKVIWFNDETMMYGTYTILILIVYLHYKLPTARLSICDYKLYLTLTTTYIHTEPPYTPITIRTERMTP